MPNPIQSDRRKELLKIVRSVRNSVRATQAFGEEDFPAVLKIQRPPDVPSVLAPQKPASSLSKKERLEALYSQYSDCRNCPLAASRQKIVFGMGSLDPKVLFVGEGPGYEEDRQGLPFVGKAGALLDKILASIGLSRESVYIANIVKCHPLRDPSRPDMRGNDRPPEFDEIESCRPILDQQIEILEPPVLCALGSTAAKALLRTTEGITRLRGRVVDFSYPSGRKTVPLIPTYHPAALLRNEVLKKDVWQDMKLLKSLLI